ncbi:MAG: hypothetical protein EZS28_045857, partial [Streblomastix strix]
MGNLDLHLHKGTPAEPWSYFTTFLVPPASQLTVPYSKSLKRRFPGVGLLFPTETYGFNYPCLPPLPLKVQIAQQQRLIEQQKEKQLALDKKLDSAGGQLPTSQQGDKPDQLLKGKKSSRPDSALKDVSRKPAIQPGKTASGKKSIDPALAAEMQQIDEETQRRLQEEQEEKEQQNQMSALIARVERESLDRERRINKSILFALRLRKVLTEDGNFDEEDTNNPYVFEALSYVIEQPQGIITNRSELTSLNMNDQSQKPVIRKSYEVAPPSQRFRHLFQLVGKPKQEVELELAREDSQSFFSQLAQKEMEMINSARQSLDRCYVLCSRMEKGIPVDYEDQQIMKQIKQVHDQEVAEQAALAAAQAAAA